MGRRYLPCMLALAGLFVLRVLAQLIQAVRPVPFLPPFEAWHGAVLPYPLLVAVQIVVILMMVRILRQVQTDSIVPGQWKHRMCFVLGGIYFSFMGFRLCAGLTFLANHAWFSKSLPAFFHVVLAAFILTLGHYIYKKGAKPSLCSGGQTTNGEQQRD